MAEEFGLDQGRGERRNIDGKKCFGAGMGEFEALGVEGDVAGAGDGAGDEFLAGAGGSRDEGGEVVHALVEGAPVAAHVVGEDGLPDGGAEAGGGHGASDDVEEDVVERALDLVKAREDMAGSETGFEGFAGQEEGAVPVGEELAVELPAAVGFDEARIVALVEEVVDGVFVDSRVGGGDIRGCGEAVVEAFDEGFELAINTGDVGEFGIGVGDRDAPDGFGGDEFASECGALPFDAFGKEGIGVGEAGRSGEEAAFGRGEN